MLNTHRVWGITDVADVDTLAADLTQMHWTLCQGFRIGGYLFLNDSTSEDGAIEYGIVREADGVQVESVTFGWCTTERATGYIRAALNGEYTDRLATVASARIQTPEQHGCCPLCA